MSAVIFFTAVSPAFAAKSVSELKKQMEERNESIKQTEKEINAKKSEKDEAVQKRNSLDLQISAMLDDISDVEEVINEKEAEINAKNAEIEALTLQIEETNNKLKTRLKVMYEYGTTSYLQLILESKGLSDLVTRLSVVKRVYDYDKNVIAEFINTKQQVEDARQLIVNEQKEQIEARDILEKKKSSLEALKSEKQQIIDELNSDINALEKEEKQKEADYEALKNELNAALAAESSRSSKSVYTGNGQFAWPSDSSTRITSSYGYRTHPISGKQSLHRGIDIGAALGSNVLAAESGTVVTAGWKRRSRCR